MNFDPRIWKDRMSDITVPAARVKQGNLCLYTTSLKVGDLMRENFYNVETLDPDDPEDKGYQRLLNKARAKKLADYILEGMSSQDAFLPTSIFLATDKHIRYEEETHSISFNIRSVGPFSVVDGQHRVEGLKMAAEKNPAVLDFEVPVNIAIDLPKIAQMCHFLIVNTTQKSVDKSVEQRIFARLTDAVDVEDTPTLPKWIEKAVNRGEDQKALQLADYINEAKGSPWYNKIKMANTDGDAATITQKSFVKAIIKYLLTPNNPIAVLPLEKQKKVLFNYWVTIAGLLDIDKPTVLYKYNGVELFSKFSLPFFTRLQNIDFTQPTMKSVLKETFENMEGDHVGVGHPEWWLSGNAASYMNASAINVVAQDLAKALHKAGMNRDIAV